MAENQDLPENTDPRLTNALRDLGRAESGRPDDVTRRRHLVAMRKARAGRRANIMGVSAAAAAVALIVGVATVSNNNGGTSLRSRNATVAADTLPPLKEAPKLSAVPFERSEDYVILNVSADRAKSVASELSSAMGSDVAVIGKTSKVTTFVVPQSAAQSLTDTSGITATPDTPMKATAEQTNPPSWGLDRVDSATLDDSYKYISEGAGEYVYVIDTGVYAGHSDFGGRVQSGYDAVNDGNGTNDCNGHGTHVSGTIAGNKYGVAKSATIVAIRVLDCSGSGWTSSVVAGINWAIASHPGGAGIINMSLGGLANSAVDTAVKAATDAGLVVVVAAGNSSDNACNYSPARAPSALTIGAIDRTNATAGYSNYGSCVDMWAPGSQITSAGISGSTSSATMSGTSMASPHVAGLAARIMQARPGVSAAAITDVLTAASLTNDPAAIPVVEFAESPDFATPTTTTTDPATTTTDVATTTTDVTTTVPGVTTTTSPVVTTTVPRSTTTVPGATTTTVPRTPKTTVPRRDDDDDRNKKPSKPVAPAPRPREFELSYGEKTASSTMYAKWEDDNTPESYRIDCARLSGGVNAPIDTSIVLDKGSIVNDEKGRHRATLPVVPAAGSRCWMVSIVGSVTSSPSNVAVVPPKGKKKDDDDDRRPPVTTTTVAPTPTTVAPAPTTTTTVAPTTTTTEVPVVDTTTTLPPVVGPTTTVAAANKVNGAVTPKAPATTAPKKKKG